MAQLHRQKVTAAVPRTCQRYEALASSPRTVLIDDDVTVVRGVSGCDEAYQSEATSSTTTTAVEVPLVPVKRAMKACCSEDSGGTHEESYEEYDDNDDDVFGDDDSTLAADKCSGTAPTLSHVDPLPALVVQLTAATTTTAAALLLAVCLVVNSAILAYQFHPPLQYDADPAAENATVMMSMSSLMTTTTTNAGSALRSSTATMAASSSSSSLPWQPLLRLEMSVLTNLLHGALLAAAAVVVHGRGDVVGLYLLRNTALLWTPVAGLYAADYGVRLWRLLMQQRHNSGGDAVSMGTVLLLLVVTLLFAGLSAFLWIRYGATCRAVRHRLAPTTTTTATATRLLWFASALLQTAALTYYAVTGAAYFRLQYECSSSSSNDTSSTPSTMASLVPFVMSYSEAGHAAFLLALVQLAATYPADAAAVAGAGLVAAWRLSATVASLHHDHQHDHRDDPWFATALVGTEIATMALVLVAAAVCAGSQMPYRLSPAAASTATNTPTHLMRSYNDDTSDDGDAGKCGLPHSDDVCDQLEDGGAVEKDGVARDDETVARFDCVTVSRIAASDSYSRRQRWGAQFMSVGSLVLLAEMTAESCLLQSQTLVGSPAAHAIYKWGMHACVMYAFCTSMSVVWPSVYQWGARPLLALACPTGSVVALWQLSVLMQQRAVGDGEMDVWSTAVAVLFVVRAVCGVLQTVGVVLLNDTEPCHDHHQSPSVPESNSGNAALSLARARAERALYWTFVPAVAAYMLVSVLYSGSQVMTHTMAPPSFSSLPQDGSCLAADMDLMLVPSMPGLGLYFHFGLVGILFVYDGIQKSVPTFKPSLVLATLCIGHIALLTLVDLLWDLEQSQFWSSLSTEDVVRRILLLLWSLSSSYLALSLHRLSKLRLLPL